MGLPKFPDAETRHKKLVYIKNNWQLYVFFALPAVLLTLIFKYVPMGGLAIAFEDYNNRLGIFGSDWIWFENFQRFLSSTEFPRLMVNTLKLSVYGLLWGFFPPIILAILLSRVRRVGIRKKIQLLIYAPNFISVIVLAGMIIAFLSPVGPINAALGTQSNLMTDPAAFRPIYIISGIWQGAGWASIIYTAALSGVSGDLVDACNIDGASLLQQIWNVDIPTLKPIMVIQFILSAGQIMNIGFEKALALQTDLNRAASEIIPTYVYRLGLEIGAVNVWNIILARTYYKSIPLELHEAAALDGASELQYFFRILIPVCKPIIAVLVLYQFVGMWNSYFDAMIYLEDQSLQPLQLVIRSILVQNTPRPGMVADAQNAAMMAKIAEQLKYSTIVVSSVPLLVMYPFFQKYFEKGVMLGSVKG